VAHDEDAADERLDGAQDERELHLLLPDDGRERVEDGRAPRRTLA
jgi:hypothetical protein